MTSPVFATVAASYGRRLLVETDDLVLHRAIVRNRKLRPLCGDRVGVLLQAGDAVIEKIEPRSTCLWRQDKVRGKRPVAANIDTMLIVATPHPRTSAEQIDRYLAIAQLCGLNAIIVQNKSDLDAYPLWAETCNEYKVLGYETLACSVKTGTGLEKLRTRLGSSHAVMAGLSGAGKSSLINALIPDIETRTSALSAASGEGRHTTTASRLYRLPTGGWIIDAPGVRDIRLWPMPANELIRGYPDLLAYAGQCRFNDCCHRDEPHCAVRAQAETGNIKPRRYRSYCELSARLGGR